MILPDWLRELPTHSLRALARLYRRPLPQASGTLRVSGLRAPVEILRDRFGVPHLYAGDLEDALFAQGFVHAQDRLWQMELNRRVGHGRLAELVGAVAFETDVLLRTLGLGRAARATLSTIDDETQRALEAYARGVNAWLSHRRFRAPLELALLGAKPEPWTPLDTLAWGQMMAFGLSTNWDAELVNAALSMRLGPERAARLKGELPRENPIILPEQLFAPLYDELVARFRSAAPHLPLAGLSGMSNNWVVAGAKSATGRPLLANDPHLAPQMPSIWYQNHLVCPELEVTGVSLPGAPGVVIGHNADIAWGLTAALPDTMDLFIEKLDPSDPTRYEFEGAWERAEVLREEVRVKGEPAPRSVEITVTRHGPIVSGLSPLARGAHGYSLALNLAGRENNRISRATLRLNTARNWSDFRAALADWDAPAMNVVYADREGHIGYQMTGRVPVRKRPGGLVPQPGWTGEHEWVGFIPPDELPHALDPEEGYFASANNRVAGPDYPHFLGHETMNGFRARRIIERLTEKERLSLDDFARLQVDQFCRPAAPFCALLVSLGAKLLDDPALASRREKAARALDALAAWDHVLSADSRAGAIYELTLFFAERRLLEPWLGALTEHVLGVGFHPLLDPVVIGFLDRTQLVVGEILIANEKEWLKDQTREALLARALYDALHYLERTLGQDESRWSWGAIHPVAFRHPLGGQKPLDRIFNRGPYPYGGDTNTVWQAAFVPRLPIEAEGGFTASYRQLIDLGDWDASRAIHTTGQSGHPASPHYDDFIPLWLAGEYHPLLWSRERVLAHLQARLDLEPA